MGMYSDITKTEKQMWKEEWKREELELNKQRAELLFTQHAPNYFKSERFADKYKQLFLDNN